MCPFFNAIDMKDIGALYFRYCKLVLYLPRWYRNRKIIWIFCAMDILTSCNKLDTKLKEEAWLRLGPFILLWDNFDFHCCCFLCSLFCICFSCMCLYFLLFLKNCFQFIPPPFLALYILIWQKEKKRESTEPLDANTATQAPNSQQYI